MNLDAVPLSSLVYGRFGVVELWVFGKARSSGLPASLLPFAAMLPVGTLAFKTGSLITLLNHRPKGCPLSGRHPTPTLTANSYAHPVNAVIVWILDGARCLRTCTF